LILAEIVRLLVLIVVVLPLALLLSGPALVLAALRGRQRVGPIVLNPGQRGRFGRVWACLLGLLLWLAVWGGLAFLLGRTLRPTTVAHVPPPTLVTVSPAPALETPTAVATATLPPSSTPLPPPTPAAEPTHALEEATPTAILARPTETVTASPSPPLPTPTPLPSPTPAQTSQPDQAALAIAAVEAANEQLRMTVVQPSEENLAALEQHWKESSLDKAKAFAISLHQVVGAPMEVSYVYLIPPTVSQQLTSSALFVNATEVWTYSGSRDSHTETYEFFYTLAQRDDQWVIIDYVYRNGPLSTPPHRFGSLFPAGQQGSSASLTSFLNTSGESFAKSPDTLRLPAVWQLPGQMDGALPRMRRMELAG
jgi:hypothetical protein